MEKTYHPENIEQHWYQKWESSGYFEPRCEGQPYCIMLPPPNVTGTLHMGHGFQISLMDALIRYHRMRGFKTLWQVGTDHAGIATQVVVELQLLNEGKSREELGREKFLERVWAWKDKSDGTIKNQLRRMGASVDWTKERFSLDEGISLAVQEVFIKLFEEHLIYRGKKLVNWDPVLLTAISDLEVMTKEEEGSLWYIRYPLVEESGYVIVATTRPETMFGDTAVAVHPEDARYKHLIGKHIKLPLTDKIIPIIGDVNIDQDFGSGCVKITPAHDFNDYAIAERHQLPLLNIFTSDAHLNENVPTPYLGLDRFEARQVVLQNLTAQGLLEKTTPHILKVPRGERSGAVVEPFLTDQWFLKTKSLADSAIKVVSENYIKFIPDNWRKTYFQWLEEIQDWCLSRQLWWGHRIPAWYDQNGNIYVGRNDEEIRQKYSLAQDVPLTQDEDVLDTWFSSSLWPFATLGWPQETDELQQFYPTSVLVTGFDIIFFWVARMVMMGLKFTQSIPFQEVYITGLIRDNEGQKMSKSKGNILDPIDLIDGIDLDQLIEKRTKHLIHRHDAEKITAVTRKDFPQGIPPFGTDSLRFTYYALASTGRDVRFDLGRIEGYRNFCNKLWNAARFVLLNTEDKDIHKAVNFHELNIINRWILSRLQHTIQNVHKAFKNYRFDLLAQTIYEFIWNEYCDWYLELAKVILYSDNSTEAEKSQTRYVLVSVLETALRLTHPLMPFITEEIWQKVSGLVEKQGATIMLQLYPEYDQTQVDEDAESAIQWLKDIVIGIRNIRGEMNIAPNQKIPALFAKGDERDEVRHSYLANFIKSLAKLSDITWVSDTPPPAATTLVNQLEIYLPLASLIDKDAEISRLNKEVSKIRKEIDRSATKLANPNYIAKAPTEVVTNEKQRMEEMQNTLNKLENHLETLEKL